MTGDLLNQRRDAVQQLKALFTSYKALNQGDRKEALAALQLCCKGLIDTGCDEFMKIKLTAFEGYCCQMKEGTAGENYNELVVSTRALGELKAIESLLEIQ